MILQNKTIFHLHYKATQHHITTAYVPMLPVRLWGPSWPRNPPDPSSQMEGDLLSACPSASWDRDSPPPPPPDRIRDSRETLPFLVLRTWSVNIQAILSFVLAAKKHP